MENSNAVLISKDSSQKGRMIELRNLVRTQLTSLDKLNNSALNILEDKTNK